MFRSRTFLAVVIAVLGCALLGAFANSQSPPPPPTAEVGPAFSGTPIGTPVDAPAQGEFGDQSNADMEAQTRGPVHEAFAEPVQAAPQASTVISKEPPPAIDEVPPDEKPDGSNIVWIPGYWGWDDERNDFLWVSGVYRAVPWDRTFVSGYWHQVQGGWQWVPGFWTNSKKNDVAYLPQPPATLEQGPTSAAPAENYFWVPGTWSWRPQYRWRPGYWTRIYPDWIWIPAHYVWTPGGYVFVDGYWDYPLAQRGVLFAPVYYRRPIFLGPRYFFSPSIVINTGALTLNLFTRPAFGSYYFGDYYGNAYLNLGYRPWFAATGRGRFAYDPLFNYYRWQNVNRDRNPNWLAGMQRRYDTLQKDPRDRPPRDLAAQQKILAKFPGGAGALGSSQRDAILAMPLKQVAAAGGGRFPGNSFSENYKFTKIDSSQQQLLRKKSFDAQQAVLKERKQMEDVKVGGASKSATIGRFPGATGTTPGGASTLADSPRSFKLPSATIAGAGSNTTPGSAAGTGGFNSGRVRRDTSGGGLGTVGKTLKSMENQGQPGTDANINSGRLRTNRGTSSFPGFDSGSGTPGAGSSNPGGGNLGTGKSGTSNFPRQIDRGSGGGSGSGSGGRLRNTPEKTDKPTKGADFPGGSSAADTPQYDPRNYVGRTGNIQGEDPANSALRTPAFRRDTSNLSRNLNDDTDGTISGASRTPGFGTGSDPVRRLPQQYQTPIGGRRTPASSYNLNSQIPQRDPVIRTPADTAVQLSAPRQVSKPVLPSGGSTSRGRLRDRDQEKDKDKDKDKR